MLKSQILKEYLLKKNFIDVGKNVQMLKTDSRIVEKGDVFLAINSGNDFVQSSVERGASVVIYDRGDYSEYENTVKVEDSIKFLQEYSNYYLKKISPIVIAVTGSNGKTSTKDILYSILQRKYKGKKTMGNYNNHIGLPLSILQLEKDDEFIILEMGMSAFGEIKRLAEIAEPDYGIITNIGESHLEYLETKENVFKAKTELIPFVEKDIFVNGDDYYLKDLHVRKSGFELINDLMASNLETDENGSKFDLEYNGKKYKIKTNLRGKHNISNLLLAVNISLDMGIELEDIKEAIQNIELSKMRFQEIDRGGTLFINDAYNASPSSMKASLELFSGIYNDRFKIAVIGDMLELGNKSRMYHEELKEKIDSLKIDRYFLFGKEMKYLYNIEEANSKVKYFESKSEIVDELNKIEENKVVFLKASRGIKLEEIIE